MQNDAPKLASKIADEIMEIINRHGENTSEGCIYWNKTFCWDKGKYSPLYNAEEECRTEVRNHIATELERQRREYVEAVEKRSKEVNIFSKETGDRFVKDVLAILGKARE